MKNFLTPKIYPKNPKMCDPIQVTLLKAQPRYSQTGCENATSSSDTSPLASNKEVHPPPPPGQNLDLMKSSLYVIQTNTIQKRNLKN